METETQKVEARGATTKKGLNFIATKIDPIDRILHWALSWGLGVGVLTAVLVVGMSVYQYSLQQRLNVLNTNVEQVAATLQAEQEFEYQFLTTQEKLDVYADMGANEQMIDLFPILSALVPDQVQVKDLILEPNHAEIVAFAYDRSAFELFVSNLRLADGRSFSDGQTLTVINPQFTDVTQMANSSLAVTDGYEATLSFDYTIE